MMSKEFYKKYDGKLTHVVNIYYVDKEDREYNFQTGLVLELEDGRFLLHSQEGYVVPFSQVKETENGETEEDN